MCCGGECGWVLTGGYKGGCGWGGYVGISGWYSIGDGISPIHVVIVVVVGDVGAVIVI